MRGSYFRHCELVAWAPDAVNVTRQADARAAPSASLIRVPAASPSAILIGIRWPVFQWDSGTGEKNPRIRYSTTYVSDSVPVLPALSVAVHSTVWTPGFDVSPVPQLELAPPGGAWPAFGGAVTPAWPTTIGDETLSVGSRTGSVASSLNAADAIVA